MKKRLKEAFKKTLRKKIEEVNHKIISIDDTFNRKKRIQPTIKNLLETTHKIYSEEKQFLEDLLENFKRIHDE